MTTHGLTVRPCLDTVTGDIRNWEIVRDGVVVHGGCATDVDAKHLIHSYSETGRFDYRPATD